jgi:zinc transport system substrate-binding protein
MKFVKIILLFLFTSSVAPIKNAFAQNKPVVVVSINPIHQILLAITEDKNNSILIINPAISEHDYQLKKRDAEAVAKSDLVFYIDENLEKNFAKLVKNKKAFQLSQINGIKLLPLRDNPQKIDYHLWMNPENAIKIAEFITAKLCEIDVTNYKKYQRNLLKFKSDVARDENVIRQKFEKIKTTNYIFYHGGFQYFEDYFALKPIKTLSTEHDEDLSINDVRAIDSLAQTHQLQCLFGDPYDEKNSARKLAQNYAIRFVTLDLIGAGKDYGDMLLGVANNMVGCLE